MSDFFEVLKSSHGDRKIFIKDDNKNDPISWKQMLFVVARVPANTTIEKLTDKQKKALRQIGTKLSDDKLGHAYNKRISKLFSKFDININFHEQTNKTKDDIEYHDNYNIDFPDEVPYLILSDNIIDNLAQNSFLKEYFNKDEIKNIKHTVKNNYIEDVQFLEQRDEDDYPDYDEMDEEDDRTDERDGNTALEDEDLDGEMMNNPVEELDSPEDIIDAFFSEYGYKYSQIQDFNDEFISEDDELASSRVKMVATSVNAVIISRIKSLLEENVGKFFREEYGQNCINEYSVLGKLIYMQLELKHWKFLLENQQVMSADMLFELFNQPTSEFLARDIDLLIKFKRQEISDIKTKSYSDNTCLIDYLCHKYFMTGKEQGFVKREKLIIGQYHAVVKKAFEDKNRFQDFLRKLK